MGATSSQEHDEMTKSDLDNLYPGNEESRNERKERTDKDDHAAKDSDTGIMAARLDNGSTDGRADEYTNTHHGGTGTDSLAEHAKILGEHGDARNGQTEKETHAGTVEDCDDSEAGDGCCGEPKYAEDAGDEQGGDEDIEGAGLVGEKGHCDTGGERSAVHDWQVVEGHVGAVDALAQAEETHVEEGHVNTDEAEEQSNDEHGEGNFLDDLEVEDLPHLSWREFAAHTSDADDGQEQGKETDDTNGPAETDAWLKTAEDERIDETTKTTAGCGQTGSQNALLDKVLREHGISWGEEETHTKTNADTLSEDKLPILLAYARIAVSIGVRLIIH